jgi:hypothetical protein
VWLLRVKVARWHSPAEACAAAQNFPDKYIWEPWKAPKKAQEEAGCIIGVDYPAPIVDHAEASKICIQRMKAAYDAGKEAHPVQGSPDGKRSEQAAKPEMPAKKKIKR